MFSVTQFIDRINEPLNEDEQIEYLDKSRHDFLITLRILLLIAGFVTPLWLVFDYIEYPDLIDKTLGLRAGATAVYFGIYGLTFLSTIDRYASFIGAFLVCFVAGFVFYVVHLRGAYVGGEYDVFDLRTCVFFALLLLAFFPSFLSAVHTSMLAIVVTNITVALLSDDYVYDAALLNFPIMTMCLISLGLNISIANNKKRAFRFQKETHHMAITDELTGLYNRRYFLRQKEEIARAQRYARPLSLIMMDVDHFKKVNDQYGHNAGDIVLQELSKICANKIRQADLMARMSMQDSQLPEEMDSNLDDIVLGRIGGEEYAILLPETDVDGAQKLAERMRVSIEQTSIEVSPSVNVEVTMSFGISTLQIKDKSETLEAMIGRADRALYEAKNKGRNLVVVFDESCQEFRAIND